MHSCRSYELLRGHVAAEADVLQKDPKEATRERIERLKREGVPVKVRHVAEVLAGRTGDAPAIGEVS